MYIYVDIDIDSGSGHKNDVCVCIFVLGFSCLQSCMAVCLLPYLNCSEVAWRLQQRLTITFNSIKLYTVIASQEIIVQEG